MGHAVSHPRRCLRGYPKHKPYFGYRESYSPLVSSWDWAVNHGGKELGCRRGKLDAAKEGVPQSVTPTNSLGNYRRERHGKKRQVKLHEQSRSPG